MTRSAGFRAALSQFATGVAIVTARVADELVGLTITSFNSVSLHPPLVLFSISRTVKSLPTLLKANGFAISVLAREQEGLSNQFARALSDKWKGVETEVGSIGAPLIRNALAHFECVPYATYDGGDHAIIVVEVVSYSLRGAARLPLVFFRGRYYDLDVGTSRESNWLLSSQYW